MGYRDKLSPEDKEGGYRTEISTVKDREEKEKLPRPTWTEVVGSDRPRLYWEQAPDTPEEKDTLLKKIGRFLLPKSLETKLELREPTEYEKWVKKEDARFAYYRNKKLTDRIDKEIKKAPQIPEDYKEPEGYWGNLIEGIKSGYINHLKGGIGYFIEAFGHTVGSPERIRQGIEMGDETTIELLKKPELNRPKDLKPFFKGGALDPRWYGRTIGETTPFMVSTIGMATVGGFIGGPVGAAVGGYGSVYALEKGNFYKELIRKGYPQDKANTYATAYGAISSAIENAYGISPAKVGMKFSSKAVERVAYNSFKSYLRKEIPKLGARTLKTAMAEGGEEIAQGISRELLMGWAETKKPEFDEQLAEEFMGGFVASIPFGVATNVNIPKISKGKIKPTVPAPKVEITPESIIQEGSEKIRQNQDFDTIKEKLAREGVESLTPHELSIISEGKKRILDPEEGVKDLEKEDVAAEMIEDLYSGVSLHKLKEIPTTIRETKKNVIDELGSSIIRYWGLTPDVKNKLIELEGRAKLRKEDLQGLFMGLFPVSKEQARTLTRHQENPEQTPIPDELQPYARRVEGLINLSKRLQESRPGLQKEFFPQSFINDIDKRIAQEKEIIPTLKSEKAIKRHQKRITELKEKKEFLEGIRYIPHAYLQSETMQKNFLKLLPEGKLTSKFRSTLSKLKGRKIATLKEARELGLVPEEDVRVLLASHFEYLLRKIQIYDTMEALKKNPTAMLPENFEDLTKSELTELADSNNIKINPRNKKATIIKKIKEEGMREAPDNWDSVAISQLSKYKVNPLLTSVIKDLGTNSDRNIISKGYDILNRIGKMAFFYNPIILPFWDVIQGVASGGIKIRQPLAGATIGGLFGGVPGALVGTFLAPYLSKKGLQAIKSVAQKDQIYRESVKKDVFSTPETVGRMSPPMEQSMQVLTNRIEKEYPGWKKAVEKIIGEPTDWKTFTPLTLYRGNWRITWTLDRILRTMTLQSALDKGMSIEEAARYTKKFHADYNIFTRKTKKWANRAFLVPTYKANMLFNLPSYIAKNTFKIAKNIKEGEKSTPEQKAALGALFRIGVLGGTMLAVAGWRDYWLREGYRLVKKLEEPEVTEKGEVLQERVITLPGPFVEWPKLAERLGEQGIRGLYMYTAKVPQIAWGLLRNARWNGDPYYREGASTDVKIRDTLHNIIKDFVAPYGQYDMMTREDQDALGNIMGLFGMATYKRGSTGRRIIWEIRDRQKKLQKYLKQPEISMEDKKSAIADYERFVKEKLEELENYNEQQRE